MDYNRYCGSLSCSLLLVMLLALVKQAEEIHFDQYVYLVGFTRVIFIRLCKQMQM